MTRTTREKWEQRIIRQWQRSGMDAASFSAREGLKPENLQWWRWHLGFGPRAKGRSARSAFVEVVLGGEDEVAQARADGTHLHSSAWPKPRYSSSTSSAWSPWAPPRARNCSMSWRIAISSNWNPETGTPSSATRRWLMPYLPLALRATYVQHGWRKALTIRNYEEKREAVEIEPVTRLKQNPKQVALLPANTLISHQIGPRIHPISSRSLE